jgi:NAD(P)-dependent dehydrogenase (short-subunit alcohol dehydrogenase family)
VQALIDRTMAQWGRIDILVANAGQYVRGAIVDLTADDMARSLQVNFYGAYHAVMAALPAMRAQHSGHVVLLSSMDARKGMPTDAPYVVPKAALTGFGDVLRQELRAEGIEVSTIMPGRVDTPLIASMRVPAISAKLPPERVARAVIAAIRHQPRGRHSAGPGGPARSRPDRLATNGRLVRASLSTYKAGTSPTVGAMPRPRRTSDAGVRHESLGATFAPPLSAARLAPQDRCDFSAG